MNLHIKSEKQKIDSKVEREQISIKEQQIGQIERKRSEISKSKVNSDSKGVKKLIKKGGEEGKDQSKRRLKKMNSRNQNSLNGGNFMNGEQSIRVARQQQQQQKQQQIHQGVQSSTIQQNTMGYLNQQNNGIDSNSPSIISYPPNQLLRSPIQQQGDVYQIRDEVIQSRSPPPSLPNWIPGDAKQNYIQLSKQPTYNAPERRMNSRQMEAEGVDQIRQETEGDEPDHQKHSQKKYQAAFNVPSNRFQRTQQPTKDNNVEINQNGEKECVQVQINDNQDGEAWDSCGSNKEEEELEGIDIMNEAHVYLSEDEDDGDDENSQNLNLRPYDREMQNVNMNRMIQSKMKNNSNNISSVLMVDENDRNGNSYNNKSCQKQGEIEQNNLNLKVKITDNMINQALPQNQTMHHPQQLPCVFQSPNINTNGDSSQMILFQYRQPDHPNYPMHLQNLTGIHQVFSPLQMQPSQQGVAHMLQANNFMMHPQQQFQQLHPQTGGATVHDNEQQDIQQPQSMSRMTGNQSMRIPSIQALGFIAMAPVIMNPTTVSAMSTEQSGILNTDRAVYNNRLSNAQGLQQGSHAQVQVQPNPYGMQTHLASGGQPNQMSLSGGLMQHQNQQQGFLQVEGGQGNQESQLQQNQNPRLMQMIHERHLANNPPINYPFQFQTSYQQMSQQLNSGQSNHPGLLHQGNQFLLQPEQMQLSLSKQKQQGVVNFLGTQEEEDLEQQAYMPQQFAQRSVLQLRPNQSLPPQSQHDLPGANQNQILAGGNRQNKPNQLPLDVKNRYYTQSASRYFDTYDENEPYMKVTAMKTNQENINNNNGNSNVFIITPKGMVKSKKNTASEDIIIGRQEMTKISETNSRNSVEQIEIRPTDIVLPPLDRAISRIHCKIAYKDGFRIRRKASDVFILFLFAVKKNNFAIPDVSLRAIWNFVRPKFAFYIVDIGSAQGTFVKIRYEKSQIIEKGQVFLIGAETQFHVLDVCHEAIMSDKKQTDMDSSNNIMAEEQDFIEFLLREKKSNTQIHGLSVEEQQKLDALFNLPENDGQNNTTQLIEQQKTFRPYIKLKVNSSSISYHLFIQNQQAIDQGFKIGRSQECTIQININTISRKQSRIFYAQINFYSFLLKYFTIILKSNKKWHLKDGDMNRESANGTWISLNDFREKNELRNESDPKEIEDGSEIKISDSILKIEIFNNHVKKSKPKYSFNLDRMDIELSDEDNAYENKIDLDVTR